MHHPLGAAGGAGGKGDKASVLGGGIHGLEFASFGGHSVFEFPGAAKVDDLCQAGRKGLRLGQFLAELFVAQRQRDFRLVDDPGQFAGAQQRHGANGNGAGLDHAEPAGGEHGRVGGAE